MPRTPDAHPGELIEEEGILLGDAGSDPTVIGEIRRVGSDFIFRDGVGLFNPRTGGAPVVFGSEYQQGSSLAVFTTSATTFQQRWRFTTTALPAGVYLLFAFAEIGTDGASAGATVEAQVQLNDLTTLAKGRVKPNTINARVLMGGAFHLGSISGAQNIDFDIRKVDGNGSVAMENARVVLWRAS